MAYYDPRRKRIPDYDPTGQYSDPGGYKTGVPPQNPNTPPPPPPSDDGGGGGGQGPFGGNDVAWLYDALMKQFGNAGDTGMFSGLGPRNFLAGGQYKDQLMNSVIPQLIQQYGSGAYTTAGGSAPAGTSPNRVPGWLAYKFAELPEESYWRLRKALGLAPLHG